MSRVLRAACGGLGVLLLAASLVYTFLDHGFGVVAVWAMAFSFTGLAVWWQPILDFFTGCWPGRILAGLLVAGWLFFFAVLAVILWGQKAGTLPSPPQAIVVLGGRVEDGRPKGALEYRLQRAEKMWRQYPDALLIVCGGQGADETETEASVMAAWLEENGVPASQILQEDKSDSTEQNFAFAREILAAHGVKANAPMLFVTNAFHCYRAAKYAEMAGFTQIAACPAGLPLGTVLPCYVREVFAVVYYWAFKRVDAGFLRDLVGHLGIGLWAR